LLPAYLFAGFRSNAPALVSIGGVYVVGQIAIFGLLSTVGGSDLQGLLQALMSDRPAALPQTIGDRVLVSVLLAVALFVPLAMAVWFAPVLAVLDAMPAGPAMHLSLRACLRNLPAMTVYGLVMSALLLALLFSLRIVLALIPPGLSLVREPLAMLLSTLWIALTLISAYVGYREIFVAKSKS
jgi:uncharacterized membrane protein